MLTPNTYNPNLKITSLVLIQQAGYAPQVRRPFSTKLTPETIESQNYEDVLTYAADAKDSFFIPNGWSEGRFAFALEGEVATPSGGTLEFNLSGYTDYQGATLDGKIDPSMMFFINSSSVRRKTIENTPQGQRVYTYNVANSHIYADNDWAGLISAPRITSVRPEDVYAIMSRAGLLSGITDVIDLRTQLNARPVSAKRMHVNPRRYLADVISNFKRAQLDMGFGIQTQENILDNARGYAQETLLSGHPFMRHLQKVKDGQMSNCFTMKELLLLAPQIDDVTNISMTAKPRPEYANWADTNIDTHAAWTLAMGVPALMEAFSCEQIKFSATNRLTKEQYATEPQMQHDITLHDLLSTPYQDAKALVGMAIKQNVERYLLDDISLRGQMEYRVHVESNLYGNTTVEIAVNGGEQSRFCMPTYADSLFTPLLMTEGSEMLAQDIEQILHHATEELTNHVPGSWGAL